MKIYTRGGDEGETGLFGGDRVSKTDPRVRAYGTVDELNAALGLALALDDGEALDRERVAEVQADLFAVGARLAAARPERAVERGSIPRLPESRVEELEAWIDELQAELPPLDAFILPGGRPAGAQLHVARTVCRRAERTLTPLLEAQPELGEVVFPYLNRLSDLLFVLARAANHRAGAAERTWRGPRRTRPAGEDSAGEDPPRGEAAGGDAE